MAGEFEGMAKALQIPANMLNNLDKVDEKINKIATDSENMAKAFQAAMQRMGDGSGTLLQRLTEIQGVFKALGGTKASGLDNIASGMGKVATEGEKTASAVAKAAEAMNKFGNSGMNIAELRASIQGINKELRTEDGVRPFADQQHLVNYRKQLQDELKEQETSNQEKIKKEQEADTRAYNNWLKLKDQELREEQRIENEKQKVRERNVQKYLRQLEEQNRKQKQWAEENQKASTSGEDYAQNRRKVELMYRDMFDSIEREEQKSNARRIREQEKMAREQQRIAQQQAREQERLAERQAKLDSRLRRSNYQDYVTSTEGSLRTAERATNYNERAQAIKNLEAAMKRLNTSDANYEKNLKKLADAHKRLVEEQNKFMRNMGRIETQQSNLMNHSQQLARQLALIFSVSAIEGYVRKLIEVRGEFEKQNVALTTLLGNKDQADKLQGQIVELAVQSPFSLRELTTYAKSLAAYQVQYEELYDTTKMLADVASGLGVDMQRLILAFGQVKASNFLRGTETRQFTEAGINMLGELAKYYSELEGRIVSVGEVQERQFRRMISFQDVEEVFKRLTSAGGMFYNMQENQAKTLAGLWTNLTDSIDVMFNEIGVANDTTLKNFVILIRDIIENWREVAWYLEKVAFAFGVYKAAVLLAQLGSSNFVKSAINMDRVIGRLNIKIPILSKSLLFLGRAVSGIIAGGALLLVTWLIDLWRQSTKASREAELLANNLKTLVSTDSGNLDKTIKALDDLIVRFKLSNEGSQERRDIISSLNSNYGEYLDFIVDETTSLEDLTSAYDDVIKRMKERAALSTLEKGYQQINNAYEESLTEARESFEKELGRGLRVKGAAGFNRQLIPTEEEINNIYNILQQKIRETDTELIDSSNEQRNLFQQIIQDYYGKDVYLSQDYLKTIPLIDAFIQKKEQEERLEKNINSQYKETLKSREANLALSRLENDYEKEKRDIQNQQLSSYETQKKLREASQKFELNKIDIQLQYGEISEESAKRAKERIINWATSTTEDVNKALSESLSKQGFSEEDISKVLISQDEQSAGISAVIKNTTSAWETQNQIIAQQIQLKNEGNRVDDNLLENAVKLEQLYRKRAEILGIELDYEEKINQATLESINEQMPEKYHLDLVDAQKSVNALQEEYINKYNEAVKMQETLNNQKNIGVVIDEAALALANEQVENYDKLRKLLGWAEEEKKSGRGRRSSKDPMLERFENIIKLIEEAKKRYDELNEEFGSKVATQMVRTQFADTEAGDLIATMTFDAQGVIDGLSKALQETGRAAETEFKKVFQEASRPFETKLLLEPQIEKREQIEKEIERMFSQYELSIQLKSTGVPDDIIKELFNTDIINLDTLKAKLLAMRPILEAQGFNWQEVWEETEKKLTEATEKETEERLKRYAEYMKKSISERTRIELEAQEEIAKVQSMKELSPNMKEAVSQNIRKNADIEIGKLNWEDFQGSEIYQRLFQDLEYLSTASIERIKSKLDELKQSMGELSPENLKTINEYYSQLEESLSERNPFKAMSDSLREINELRKEGKTEESLQSDLINLDTNASLYTQQIQDLELIIGMKEKGLSLDALDENLLNRNNAILGKNTEELRMLLSLKKGQLNQTNTQIGITQKDLDSYTKARKNADKLSNTINDIKTLGGSAFGSISEIIDSMGSGMSENEKIIAGMTGGLLDLVAQAVLFGIQLQLNTALAEIMGQTINAALGPIGWSVMALQSLTSIFTAFSKIHDNKLQEQIDAEQKKIDSLNKTYEKLEKTIKNGLSIWEYSESGNQIELLMKQIESYERMIELEKDKKKTDEGAIQGWQEDIESIYEQIDEIYKNIKENLIGDFKDAASQLADALQEAFASGEDAAKSWRDTVDDIIAEIIKNFISVKLIEPLLQPVLDSFYEAALPKTTAASNYKEQYEKRLSEMDEIDKAMETASFVERKQMILQKLKLKKELDNMAKEYEALNESAKGEIPNITEDILSDLDNGLTGIYDIIENEGLLSMLDKYTGKDENEGDTLGGLQKGIQGITEQTAQALEAILESIRLFVSDENLVIHNIYNWLIAPPAETPLMQELRLQTQHLASVDSLLASVIKNSSGKGRVMKVEIV